MLARTVVELEYPMGRKENDRSGLFVHVENTTFEEVAKAPPPQAAPLK